MDPSQSRQESGRGHQEGRGGFQEKAQKENYPTEPSWEEESLEEASRGKTREREGEIYQEGRNHQWVRLALDAD